MPAPSRLRLLSSAAAVAAVVALSPRPAAAKREFVDLIATHLTLPYEPPCRLCHIQGTTGSGTIQTPFGVSMLAHGMTKSGETVTPALDAMAADRTDSDGDGRPDIDELAADEDPNTAVNVPLGPGGPTYGCAVGPGRPASAGGAAALSAVLAMVAIGRRRRRRTRARARAQARPMLPA
jgi:hypothetical protein